jgi:hypothetical protein
VFDGQKAISFGTFHIYCQNAPPNIASVTALGNGGLGYDHDLEQRDVTPGGERTEIHNFPQHVFPSIHYLWCLHLEWDAASDRQWSIPSSRHEPRGSLVDATGRHVYQGRRETSCQELSLITSALRQLSCLILLPRTKHLAKQDWPTGRPTDRSVLIATGILVPARAEHRHVCEHEFYKMRLFENELLERMLYLTSHFCQNMNSFDTYYLYTFSLKHVLRVKYFRMAILQNVGTAVAHCLSYKSEGR